MAFIQIDYVTGPTIFEPHFLLPVSSINNRSREIISFLSLNNIVQYLPIVGKGKIPNGKYLSHNINPILLHKGFLEEGFLILVFHLTGIYQDYQVLLGFFFEFFAG